MFITKKKLDKLLNEKGETPSAIYDNAYSAGKQDAEITGAVIGAVTALSILALAGATTYFIKRGSKHSK